MHCILLLDGEGYADTLGFRLMVGEIRPDVPIPDGPRRPVLYWAYDDVDTAYPEHPSFDWVEIRDVGTLLDLSDNQTVQIELPPDFGLFTYYGRTYGQVSICSNGWIAPGHTTYSGWSNRELPCTDLPPMLAPSWDDYYPRFGYGILYHHDPAGHRFIIEWDSLHYRSPYTKFDKFQIILYDATLAARDGNSEFVYQYLTANYTASNTIGLQDSTGTVGITVVNDSIFHRAATEIVPGRAIKFSTNIPVPGVVEPETGTRKPDSPALLTAFPNPFRNGTKVSWQMRTRTPAGLRVYDIAGRPVATLASGNMPPGEYHARWNGRDALGRPVASGVYFMRLETPGQAVSAKLVLQD